MPGTLLADQFAGDWEGYFAALAAADPPASALGITDYFTLRGYKAFVGHLATRDVPGLAYVFPNVELRLTVETERRNGINLHLLVASEDASHVERIEEKLSQLTFPFRDDRFLCTDDGLRRLGRTYTGRELDDEQALREGANQFKVDFREVRALFDGDSWMRANVLVAIAAGQDGLGGLSRDAGMRALREELGRFADVVFSGQEGDRRFWLGDHPDFASTGLRRKPCLHGSDAHRLDRVLRPDLDRRCWILGGAGFDSLRQALVEPKRRVHIGESPPAGAPPGEVVRRLTVDGQRWLKTPEVRLNPGLVTIIGAKGSGKTALADVLAFATGSEDPNPGNASFLANARGLLGELRTEAEWGDGTVESAPFGEETAPEPRVQYLSQQFVERLSASHDISEPLVAELERVVYAAIPLEERLTTATFAELREALLQDPNNARAHEQQRIRRLTEVIAQDSALLRSLARLRAQAREAERTRASIEQAIRQIPTRVSQERVDAHGRAAAALQQLRDAIAAAELKAQRLSDVRAAVVRELRRSDEGWAGLKATNPGLLDDATWDELRPRIADRGLEILEQREAESRRAADELRDRGVARAETSEEEVAPEGLAQLVARVNTLSSELGLDRQNAARKADLEQKLGAARVEEGRAREHVESASSAPERIASAQAARLQAYEAVIATLVAEEDALNRLYGPLATRIAADNRLAKLSFVVGRVVDLDDWVARGEAMMDLRRSPYGGRGGLAREADALLLPAWQRGAPEDVRAAMEIFIETHAQQALQSLAHGFTPLDFGDWLLSTTHIRVRYGVSYEGVPISRLSPGTRGVVLLTLYLGLDTWDFRPLVIDQPEENLDPSSVQGDLVPFFRDAARRRQIVMVTHNANLVVNTDSDQVIIATSQRSSPERLPDVTYRAGGLEDVFVREQVCSLLEGGAEAFRLRGERYGVAPARGTLL